MAGQGTKIVATDFNTIQAKINLALGIGTGDYGYGQTVTSGQVSLENKIEASQWNSLRNDLIKARQHQTGLNESGNLALPTTSATIKEADRAAYNNFADVITTNRLITPPPSQGTLATLSTINRTSPWNSTASQTITCTFASIDAARYFFNTGSNLKFSASFTNFTTDTSLLVNQSWATLLTNMGIISFAAKQTTNTGTGTPQNIGYYNLSSTNQLIFSKAVELSTPSYSPNQYDLYARLGTSGAQIIFTPTFSYISGGSGGFASEPANGTLTSILQTYYATGSNVSVTPPTVVAGTITGGAPPPPIQVPSYAVSPAVSSVNEGSSVAFNVTGSNILNGTYYWTSANFTTSDADFSSTSGSFTITSNAGSFNVTATSDLLTEGAETFYVNVRTGSVSGPIVANTASALVIINDTSTTPPPTPASYTVTPSVSNVNEGSSVTFNVTGSNITNGTYYWTSANSTTSDADFLSTSGSFTITSNAGSFNVTATSDLITEGAETFFVNVRTGSTAGTIVANTASSLVTINDTSTAPVTTTVVVTPAVSNVNEGSSVTFNVTGSNITNGTYYWTTDNFTTSDADFSAISGSFTITSNVGSFNVTATSDLTTEGAETFFVNVRSGSISGTILASSNTSLVTINDTSLTPPPPTLAISPTTLNYSSVVDVAPNTQRITFTSTNGAVDVNTVSTVGATSNSITTIDYTGATGSPSTGAPFTVNGTKYIDVRYYLSSGTSGSATLNMSTTDGSKAATLNWTAVPSYAVSPTTSSVNEGSSLTFNVTTTSVINGTVLNWAINSNTGDFGTTTGTVTINSNAGSFTVTPTADATTEGAETFSVSIYTGSISGTPVATSSSVTINDTSTTPPPTPTYTVTPTTSSVNEGSSLTFNVGGTNIVDGTYYWTVTNSGDFGTSSGSFTITSNSGSFNVSPTADSTTEGSETFTASIRSGSTGGTILATSSSVTINDTSTTPVVIPTLAASVSGPSFNYVIFGPNSQTKAYYIQIFNQGGVGSFTQNWSVSTSLSIQTGFGNGTTSGTFSGSITNALIGFTGPHSGATVTVTVTASGYNPYSTTLSIPANSIYTPYTYFSGFAQEYGRTFGAVTLAQQIAVYYTSQGSFTTTLSPPTRWGLFRRPDAGGLDYWTGQAIANGWSYNSTALNNAFFAAAAAIGGAGLSQQTSFGFGTGYDTFIDRP